MSATFDAEAGREISRRAAVARRMRTLRIEVPWGVTVSERADGVQELQEPRALGGVAAGALVVLLELEVVELRALDRVVGVDVLGAADAGEVELLEFLVGPDLLAGLEDDRAVGLDVQHFAGDPGGEAVGAIDLAVALELARGVELNRRRRGAGGAALDFEVAELQLDPLLELGLDVGLTLEI